MKNLLLAAIMLVATTTQAASDTATLTISGTVNSILDIIVSPATYTTLPIVAGGSNISVASVQEVSNDQAGYSIRIHSANAGKLVHKVNSSYSEAYTIQYGARAVESLASDVVFNRTFQSSNSFTAPLLVNLPGYANAPAGTYEDVITFTITEL